MIENIRPSVDKIALESIIERRVAEVCPNHTKEILNTLEKGTNQVLFQIINSYITEEQHKLGLDRRKSYMDLYIWDPDLQIVDIIALSSNPRDLSCQTIDKVTYKDLEVYSENLTAIREEIESMIDTRKIF